MFSGRAKPFTHVSLQRTSDTRPKGGGGLGRVSVVNCFRYMRYRYRFSESKAVMAKKAKSRGRGERALSPIGAELQGRCFLMKPRETLRHAERKRESNHLLNDFAWG